MIIVCYGMIKSASTFSFQIVQEMIRQHHDAKGLKHVTLTDINDRLDFSFVDRKTDFEYLLQSLDQSEHDVFGQQHIAIKTHAPPSYFKNIGSRENVKSIANFRHPAEVALSLVDAAERDKKLQRIRFNDFDTFEKSVRQLPYQCSNLLSWAQDSDAMMIYYDNLVMDPHRTFSAVAERLGLNCDPISIVDGFISSKGEVPEYNKGLLGRRFKELEQDVIDKIESDYPEIMGLIEGQT